MDAFSYSMLWHAANIIFPSLLQFELLSIFISFQFIRFDCNPDAVLSFYDIFCSAVYAFDFHFYFYFCRSLIPFEQDNVSKKLCSQRRMLMWMWPSRVVMSSVLWVLRNVQFYGIFSQLKAVSVHYSPFDAICQCDYEMNKYVNEWVQKLWNFLVDYIFALCSMTQLILNKEPTINTN